MHICRHIHIYGLKKLSNDFHKIWYHMYFGYEKTIEISLNLVKNRIVGLFVRENRSNDFQKNWYFLFFGHEKMVGLNFEKKRVVRLFV